MNYLTFLTSINHEIIAWTFLNIVVSPSCYLQNIQQNDCSPPGNPFAEDTTVGATIHEEHARKVLGYVEEAVKEVRLEVRVSQWFLK